MLSILIPTYNYNVFPLVKEIQSQGANQSIPFELIVMDDGSDAFQLENEKINSLENCLYKVSDSNNGRTATRNALASLASYSWLLFLDADVLPLSKNFLENYISQIRDTDKDVFFGGIAYQKDKPSQEELLRWEYGRNREAKDVAEREKSPYFIISQNLLIRKICFTEANNLDENYYGLDNYFSNQLKRLDFKVGHIDNPVIHLGLESNDKFIQKALKAVETTVILENKGLMDDNMRPLQKSYLKLKRFGLTGLFRFFISKYNSKMERNFQSASPNLLWFDLYRLAHYIDLKKEKNA